MSVLEPLAAALADRYHLERELGAGGMATVYLAEDVKHKRKVAIKVLKPELAAVLGAERFVQEITTTAALQHPHILPLFDSGTVVVDATRGDPAALAELGGGGGRPTTHLYYVMPFIDGETLRSKLDRETQLGIDEAIGITADVANALEYAHRHGVIHRDIKPENILLADGRPVVADFGIALAVSAAAGGRMTETGLSLGTPHYMSPEQATAEKEITGRSDIYSLASVCYEMLAGQPPHLGGSAQQIVMKIIAEPVVPVTRFRKSVPPHVADALAQALEKLPADRFPTASAFAEALQRPGSVAIRRAGSRSVEQSPLRHRVMTGVLAALALAAGVGIGTIMRGGSEPPAAQSRRLNLLLPDNAPLALTGPGPLGIWQLAIAVSPTGNQVAYASPQGGTTMLALRPLDGDSAVILPGTEGAYHPVFSPDGEWIAYFAGADLRKVLVRGGSPITLTTVERPVGVVWHTPDELVLFQQEGFQMRRISASGGRDSVVALPAQFGAPSSLPGGDWIAGHLGSGQLALLSLADATIMAITGRGVIPVDSVHVADLLFGTSPKYVASGHLVFGAGDGALMALPFDAASRRVIGVAVPVADRVRSEEGFGFAQYAITSDGTLIYVPGLNQLYGQLVSIRPDGVFDTLPLPRAPYTQPRMSPDGTRLAVHVRKAVGGWEIVVLDLESEVVQRIEAAGGFRAYPGSWMPPDGKQLMVGLFHPVGNGFRGARMYTFADRSWEDLPRFDGSYLTISPTGTQFVYSNWRTGDLFTRAVHGDTTSTPIPARGTAASFSPDSRWLSWGGTDGQVAVSPLPPTGAVYTVAPRGQQPLWSPDGRHLIYRDGRRFFEVTVESTGGFRTGRPRLVAEGPFIRTFAWNHTMMGNGQLVAMVAMPGDATRELRVITDFPALLAQRAPTQTAADTRP